jgi:hypothetical protein
MPRMLSISDSIVAELGASNKHVPSQFHWQAKARCFRSPFGLLVEIIIELFALFKIHDLWQNMCNTAPHLDSSNLTVLVIS